jgi:uncharacterized Zn-finger protein
MKHTKIEAASSKKPYRIKKSDLPLSCPTKDMEVWNAHPKVYLPIESTGEATCPYCSSHFILKND